MEQRRVFATASIQHSSNDSSAEMGGGVVHSMVVSSYVSLFRAKRNYQSEVEYPSFLSRKKRGAHAGGLQCVAVEVSSSRGSDGLSVRTAGQVS
jgi:hypothetical protein